MDPEKLTVSLTELVKKFVISFCEVNVGYNDRLDVFGSIHIRSDDCDVVAFVLNEHCYKKSAENSEDDDAEASTSQTQPLYTDNKGMAEVTSVKTELPDNALLSQIKTEVMGGGNSDVIDIYSDEEENGESGTTGGNIVDQNFINSLLEMQNIRSQGSLFQSNRTKATPRKRGRSRGSGTPRQQRQSIQTHYSGEGSLDDFGYYQGEDVKPSITGIENADDYVDGDLDYTPGGGVDFGGGAVYADPSIAGQKKPRKRANQASASSSTGANQGSYFQVESTYTCTVCGCRFRSMDGLKCHVNSKHSQQKVYSCHFCSQTFLTRQASYSHRVKFHNISRPRAGALANGSVAGDTDFG